MEEIVDKLVPVIIQNNETNEVLMLAHMNTLAYCQTLLSDCVILYEPASQSIVATSYKVKAFYANETQNSILLKVCPLNGPDIKSDFTFVDTTLHE